MGRKKAVTTAPRKPPRVPRIPTAAKQGELIFALDIGTRTVVGIVGERREDDIFHILDAVVIPHTKRAMIDGQIEDIGEVAHIVEKVKLKLEERLKIKLSRVCIAAAGRALKTRHVKVNMDVEGKDAITEEMVKSFELEAISEAQECLDAEDSEAGFYCVGHSVVGFFLDDYPIKSIVGHKGKVATLDMLAAFLPSMVVESLYAVMDKNKLEVASLTLEPIAAMNVIIPPEVRLINIALVDIGAGTSDIAIAKDGSIVAYAMATIAGDEITEEIIKRYLVDFQTAEAMKMCADEDISFTDILGFSHTLPSTEFYELLFPAIDLLAATIVDNILAANGGNSPSAIFLVGGGSQVPQLTNMVAQKLGVPETRVAVGGQGFLKHVAIGELDINLNGPEFVTPIGIGVTATTEEGFDFSSVTLNRKKVRIFNTKNITILDLLTIAGYKSVNIIGRTGHNLAFTLNGEMRLLKGEVSTPAVITVNAIPANISTQIKQGDEILITPAINGISAKATIGDIIEDIERKTVFISGLPYSFGKAVTVSGKTVSADYLIQNLDEITVHAISTLGELMRSLPFSTNTLVFYCNKRKLPLSYVLQDGDHITVDEILPGESDSVEDVPAIIVDAPVEVPSIIEVPALEEALTVMAGGGNKAEDYAIIEGQTPTEREAAVTARGVTVTLNGHTVSLPPTADGTSNLFLELVAIANLDTAHPQGSGIKQTLNGRSANFMDALENGDAAVVAWAE